MYVMGGNCILRSKTYSKVMDLRQCTLDSVSEAAGKYRLQLSLLRGPLKPGPQNPGGRKAQTLDCITALAVLCGCYSPLI